MERNWIYNFIIGIRLYHLQMTKLKIIGTTTHSSPLAGAKGYKSLTVVSINGDGEQIEMR